MISINDVLSDRFFYQMSSFVQPSGKVSSCMLWNPEDSGVHIAVRQSWIYCAPYTAFNIKWRTSAPSALGTQYSNRNSLSLKHDTTQLAKSKAVFCINQGSTSYQPHLDGQNYVLTPFDRDPVYDMRFEVPPVLEPGTGLIWFPDTSTAMQWTHSVYWEEQPIEQPMSPA
jgi:hypothetical protein